MFDSVPNTTLTTITSHCSLEIKKNSDWIFFHRHWRFTDLQGKVGDHHCVKSFEIRSLLWTVFSCMRTEYGEYGDLRSKSLYSIQIQENTDQQKLLILTLFPQCIFNPHFYFHQLIKIQTLICILTSEIISLCF